MYTAQKYGIKVIYTIHKSVRIVLLGKKEPILNQFPVMTSCDGLVYILDVQFFKI